MPLEWNVIFEASAKGYALQVSSAVAQGRSVYTVRTGKLREDGSLASFMPVSFLTDDGASRSQPNLHVLAGLLVEAAEAIEQHAQANDTERIESITDRDARRVEREATAGQSKTRPGLSAYSAVPKAEREATKPVRDDIGRRQKDRDKRNQMKGGSAKK